MPGNASCTIPDSPVGPLTLVATHDGLRTLRFGERRSDDPPEASDHPLLQQAARELAAYFAGERTTFDVALDLAGTAFQREVWQRLCAVPYGETTTYGALARAMGDIGRARAVGRATATNPVAIIVPCHRLVGAAGSLTGFSGGLDRKRYLLKLERRHAPMRTGQGELFAAP